MSQLSIIACTAPVQYVPPVIIIFDKIAASALSVVPSFQFLPMSPVQKTDPKVDTCPAATTAATAAAAAAVVVVVAEDAVLTY